MSNPLDPIDDLFVAWVHAYAPMLRGSLYCLTRDWHLAEDLVQEVFVRAWEKRHQYQDKSNPQGYLVCIADRLVIDWSRKKKRRQRWIQTFDLRIEPTESLPAPLEEAIGREETEELVVALASLTGIQRRVLTLRYFGSLEFSAIATQLEMPIGTVLSHAHRALKILKGKLQSTEEITMVRKAT